MKLGKKYRHFTDGIVAEFNEYLKKYLTSLNFSLFFTFNDFKKRKNQRDLEKGFVFSGGRFFTINWKNFLKRSGYRYSPKKITKSEEIKGNIAFQGRARGIAKLIFNPNDFNKFKKGNILVTPMTQVTFMPIISKSAALVTDEGGITCHAAIISRELKIPCIIGTRIATKVLHDGDLVEVDADKGVVRKIK